MYTRVFFRSHASRRCADAPQLKLQQRQKRGCDDGLCVGDLLVVDDGVKELALNQLAEVAATWVVDACYLVKHRSIFFKGDCSANVHWAIVPLRHKGQHGPSVRGVRRLLLSSAVQEQVPNHDSVGCELFPKQCVTQHVCHRPRTRRCRKRIVHGLEGKKLPQLDQEKVLMQTNVQQSVPLHALGIRPLETREGICECSIFSQRLVGSPISELHRDNCVHLSFTQLRRIPRGNYCLPCVHPPPVRL
mmetsp:Transcript_13953/g.55061  ORF Transcript_13953/g.55061 Transcript_13953/m.55061 type:complete len:246 (+) Transcript_13953:77-814(+)